MSRAAEGRNSSCTSEGNSEPFLEANFRRIKMKNKIAPNVSNGFRASIGVYGFFWGAKTDFETYLGTFLARVRRGGEVQGGENAKIGHFGKSP